MSLDSPSSSPRSTSKNNVLLAAALTTLIAACSDSTKAHSIKVVGPDSDNDGIADVVDNCPAIANNDQLDRDGDKKGDVCEEELSPGCASISNPNDSDRDDDGVPDKCDNCPTVPNRGQENFDGDDVGQACDLNEPQELYRDAQGRVHDSRDEQNDHREPGTSDDPNCRYIDKNGACWQQQPEECSNGLDDDGDGEIDEVENCVVYALNNLDRSVSTARLQLAQQRRQTVSRA